MSSKQIIQSIYVRCVRWPTCDVADGSIRSVVMESGRPAGEGVGQTRAQGDDGDTCHAGLQANHTAQEGAQL